MKRFYDLKQKQVTGWLEISRLFSWQIVWEYLRAEPKSKNEKNYIQPNVSIVVTKTVI